LRVLSVLHFGSVDSTETKNLSLENSLKRSELKIGWWWRGSLFRPSMPNTAANADRSTVSSNMMGTIDGSDATDAGLPPMMIG
jgi:hypothetical protein